jgi:hypothetical protein
MNFNGDDTIAKLLQEFSRCESRVEKIQTWQAIVSLLFDLLLREEFHH